MSSHRCRAWCAGLVLAVAACGAPSASSEPSANDKPVPPAAGAATAPELGLERLSEGKIALRFRAPEERRPRMADVRVRWSAGWTLKDHVAGDAVATAQKMLQLKRVGDNEARVIVLSSANTQRLGDGTLAELRFEGSGPGTVEIVPVAPMLAPAEAEQGLHVGEPISL